EVIYTGTESGRINVEAFTEVSQSFETLELSLINPGPFDFGPVDDGTYTVVAYVDINDDGQLGEGEPWIEAGAPVAVPPGSSQITLDLDAYVVPSDGPVEEDGCCGVIDSRPASSSILLLVLGALLWR